MSLNTWPQDGTAATGGEDERAVVVSTMMMMSTAHKLAIGYFWSVAGMNAGGVYQPWTLVTMSLWTCGRGLCTPNAGASAVFCASRQQRCQSPYPSSVLRAACLACAKVNEESTAYQGHRSFYQPEPWGRALQHQAESLVQSVHSNILRPGLPLGSRHRVRQCLRQSCS